MTLTLQEVERKVARWNGYAAQNIEYHCPTSGATFIGSGNACPDCFTPLHDLSHWKWYSPDEEHPREVVV